MQHELRINRLLLMEPERFAARCALLDAHAFDVKAWDGKTDIYGSPLPAPSMAGDIAVIPLKGMMMAGYPSIYKAFGCCDTREVGEWVKSYAGRADVRGLVLDCDSPGGLVGGTAELADIVAGVMQSGKPIFARLGQACSAAQWVAASCTGIFGTKSAVAGSIGVYCVHYDASKSFELMGYKVEVFRSGKHKGAGTPGTSLSAEQSDEIQAHVAELGAAFRRHMTAMRPQVKPEDMEGQSFSAQRACEHGLMDDLLPTPEAIFALFENSET